MLYTYTLFQKKISLEKSGGNLGGNLFVSLEDSILGLIQILKCSGF